MFPAKAFISKALLLMLLLAGSAILPVISLCGNVRRWLIDLKLAILSTKLSKNLQVTKKSHNFAPTKQGTGCSAVGSAHVWGARGRKFESCHPDLRRSWQTTGSFFLGGLKISIRWKFHGSEEEIFFLCGAAKSPPHSRKKCIGSHSRGPLSFSLKHAFSFFLEILLPFQN